MSAPVRKRGFLLQLAAEAIAPVVPGCASALADERAVNRFGPLIVTRWHEWMRGQPKALRQNAISELARLTTAEALATVSASVVLLTPDASLEDRMIFTEYLGFLARCAQRGLVLDQASGGHTLPHSAADSPLSLLALLPLDAPPFPPGSTLPGIPWTLVDPIGFTTLGVCYRATRPDSSSPALVTICTNPGAKTALRQQIQRLPEDRWSERLVRRLAQDLDQATPYLVWEHVPGGDLTMQLANLKHQTGHGFAPEDVLRLIEEVAEGLAFAHSVGLVHGDVKPANVLIGGEAIKLAELGCGLAGAVHARTHSRIGSAAIEELSPADQLCLLRGTGTLLYLAPEQRNAPTPDPRQDLWSLGVLWYQLLVGDITRPLPDNWTAELSKRHVPAQSIDLLQRCLAPVEDRPRDAGAFLALLRRKPETSPEEPHAASVISPEEIRAERLRKQALLGELRELRKGFLRYLEAKHDTPVVNWIDLGLGLALALLSGLLAAFALQSMGPPFSNFSGPAGGVQAVLAMALVVWLGIRRRRRAAANLFAALKQRVRRLAGEHPEEVQTWGGKEALLNADLLPEIVASFEQDMRTLSPDIEAD
jgi:hypothetical protein